MTDHSCPTCGAPEATECLPGCALIVLQTYAMRLPDYAVRRARIVAEEARDRRNAFHEQALTDAIRTAAEEARRDAARDVEQVYASALAHHRERARDEEREAAAAFVEAFGGGGRASIANRLRAGEHLEPLRCRECGQVKA